MLYVLSHIIEIIAYERICSNIFFLTIFTKNNIYIYIDEILQGNVLIIYDNIYLYRYIYLITVKLAKYHTSSIRISITRSITTVFITPITFNIPKCSNKYCPI